MQKTSSISDISPRILFERFPTSSEDYAKDFDLLKARFPKDEVLIKVYVREL